MLVGVVSAYEPSDFFTELYSPHEMVCDSDCWGMYKFTNPTDADIYSENIGFEFWNEERDMDYSGEILYYNVYSNTSVCHQECGDVNLGGGTEYSCYDVCVDEFVGYDENVIAPGESRIIRIEAEKTDETVDWIPYVILGEPPQMGGYEEQGGGFGEDTYKMEEWALWMKGGGVATTNLYAGYHLDEASGNANDFSGNGITLTNFATVTLNKPGVFLTSANFTATTGQVLNTTSLQNFPRGGYGAGTAISFWIKPHSHATSDQQIIKLYNDTGNGQESIYLSGGYLVAALNPCGSATANAKSLYVLNQWMHIVATTNGTFTLLYVNGTYIASNILGNCPNGTTNLWIGQAKDNTVRLNSTIDEITFWNRDLNQTEITNLYMAGKTELAFDNVNGSVLNFGENITAVIGFPDQTVASNITYTNHTGGVNILRTNAGVEANYTGVELIKLNVTHYKVNAFSIGGGLPSSTNVTLLAWGGNSLISSDTQKLFFSGYVIIYSLNNTLVSQNPADLDTLNGLGPGVNITYFVNSTLNSISFPLINSIQLCDFINDTTTNNMFYTNGTTVASKYSCQLYNSNNSALRTYSTILEDNNIYPASYNINETLMEMITHSGNTMSNANALVKIQLYNVSTTTPYNFYEIMANCTGGSTSGVVYYCNSSYTTGNPTTSVNCASFGSLACGGTYNHTHRKDTTPVSSHQVFPYAISAGKINNVHVTPTSSFIFKGANIVNWRWWSITNIARADATQTSTNNGVGYSNFAGSLDSHIHQFTNLTTLYYYMSATNQSGWWWNSTVTSDSMQLAHLPPTAPNVYAPVYGNYSGIITIDYTESISPNSYAINNYTIQLMNLDLSLNATIFTNTGLILTYNWNTAAAVDGSYAVGVYACDVNGQCSSRGFSDTIQLDNTGPTVTITHPENSSYLFVSDIPLELSAVDAVNPIAKIWYSIDSGANITYTIPTTFDTVNGSHIVRAYANDTLGNVGSANVAFTTSPVPPTFTAYTLNPTTIFWSEYTIATIILVEEDAPIDDVWLQTASGTKLNVSAGVPGSQTLIWYPNGAYGVYNVYAYVNDTVNSVRIHAPITLTVHAPLNATNDQATNDLTFGRPLQAAVGVYTALLGGLFYAIIIGVIFVALWLRTNNFLFPTLILFTLTTLFGVELPGIAQQLSYGIYAVALGLIIWRLISPSYTQ